MMARLLPLLLLVGSTHGFVGPQQSRQHPVFLSSSVSSNNNLPSDDVIRRDIEAMREEAKKRLESLDHQMEDMLRKHQHDHDHDASFLASSAFEQADLPVTHDKSAHDTAATATKIAAPGSVEPLTVVAPPNYIADSRLLQDTRWKVVVKVGGNRQTDAAVQMGEKPLLVHLVIDFTPDTLQDSDELLRSGFSTSSAKVLRIKESWIGASSTTDGRQRNVKIKSTGGWKILPGQGPKGIDILRFYVDVEEEICHNDNSMLRCPAKRVYCTSGFFSMGHHSESEAFKDYLRAELDRLVNKYDDLTLEDESDEHFFSVEKVKRATKMMELRKQIKATNDRITQARIRDPEKAMLRLSRRGDVGVTKEGQVCYKVANGMSAEYHVLGKMEMASVNKPIVEPTEPSLRP